MSEGCGYIPAWRQGSQCEDSCPSSQGPALQNTTQSDSLLGHCSHQLPTWLLWTSGFATLPALIFWFPGLLFTSKREFSLRFQCSGSSSWAGVSPTGYISFAAHVCMKRKKVAPNPETTTPPESRYSESSQTPAACSCSSRRRSHFKGYLGQTVEPLLAG